MSIKAVLTVITAGAITNVNFDSMEEAKAVLNRFQTELGKCRDYSNDPFGCMFRFSGSDAECVIDLRKAIGAHVTDIDLALDRDTDNRVLAMERFTSLKSIAESAGMLDAFDEICRRNKS